MGLRLKCPHCLMANPLDVKFCAKCNASLENLPADQRVYIFDKGQAAPQPAASKPKAPKPATAEEAAPAAAAKETSSKKETSGESPAKKTKGTKAGKKKQSHPS